MSEHERARHELYRKFEDLLGPEGAATVMEHLPPFTWNQLVTREYLDLRLEAQEQRIEGLVHRVTSTLQAEINAQTRLLFLGMLGAVLTAASLAFAAVRLG